MKKSGCSQEFCSGLVWGTTVWVRNVQRLLTLEELKALRISRNGTNPVKHRLEYASLCKFRLFVFPIHLGNDCEHARWWCYSAAQQPVSQAWHFLGGAGTLKLSGIQQGGWKRLSDIYYGTALASPAQQAKVGTFSICGSWLHFSWSHWTVSGFRTWIFQISQQP